MQRASDVTVTSGVAVASDRNHKTQHSFLEGRFGVDTIALRGPVDGRMLHALPRQRVTRHVDLKTGEVVEHLVGSPAAGALPVHLVTSLDPRGRAAARVEFSAARLLHGDNRVPVASSDLRAAIGDAYDMVAKHVAWLCPPEDLTVARIDIARDFVDVADPPWLLGQLANIPAARMTGHAYQSSDGRGAQTLLREARRHTGKMYHRGPQYLARKVGKTSQERVALDRLAESESGVVRFEVQLRREKAAEEGLGHVRDLAADHLAGIARKYFSGRYRFGDVIAGPAWKFREALSAATNFGESKRVIPALGLLVADAFGLEGSQHPKTLAQYRAAYRRYGLGLGDVLAVEQTPVRFDLTLGRVVNADSRTH